MIAGCSICVVMMWRLRPAAAKKTPVSAALFASVPPLVKTISSGAQPRSAAT